MRARDLRAISRNLAPALAVLTVLAASASAQTRWTVVAGDTSWVAVASDRPHAAALDTLAEAGRLTARVDSLRGDTLFVTAGPIAVVRRVEVVGAEAVAVARRVRAGAVFRPSANRLGTRPATGSGANAGWRATKAATRSSFSSGSTEHVA